jgi:hypothetical protein
VVATAVFPAFGNSGDEHVGERCEHPPRRLAVGGGLDGACGLALLESLRGKPDEAGAELFRLGGGRRDRGPDQRNALLSLSKKP